MGFLSSLTTAFREGGIWMVFIMAAQLVSIAIIVERVFALYVLRRPNQKQLVSMFERDIKSGQLDRVISQARHVGNLNPIGVVTLAGAQAALDMGGKEEIQLKIDEILLEEQTRIEKNTNFLAMLGNVGTLLGLLGTIVGLIRAFSSVGAANPMEKAAILSQGVSEAMYATAYGLIMALPALIMFSVLQNRSQALSEDLSKASLKIYIWLGFHYEAITTPSKKRSSSETK